MFRRTFVSAVLCALSFGASISSAQTVDELVARNLQAKGGVEKLRSVEAVREVSQLTTAGAQVSVITYSRRPNLLRQEIAFGGQTIVNAYDGAAAWMINPLAGGPAATPMAGDDAEMIRSQANFDGPLVGYQARGDSVEFLGTQTMGTRTVQDLRITDKDRHVEHCYLDAATGLEVKLSRTTASGSFEQEFSDYRAIEGVMVPFSTRVFVNGALQAELKVSVVEFNPALADGMFRLPR